MKTLLILIFCTTLISCAHTAHEAAPAESNSIDGSAEANDAKLPEYSLGGTEVFDFSSEKTGQEYEIVVRVPNGYDNSDKDYPVLYVLDAMWQFPMLYTMTGAIIYDGDMPDVIIVGISWKDLSQRINEMMPTPTDYAPDSGRANDFQAFLGDELIPKINSKYRATDQRVVTGGSASAYFVFYTLLTAPELFDGYIATSPNASWDDKVLLDFVEKTPVDIMKREKRAYMAWGSFEYAFGLAQDAQELASKIENKSFNNLKLATHEVSDSGHAGVNAECYTRGLQFVFKKPELQLPIDLLNSYTGTYKSADDQFSFEVARDGQELVVALPGENAFALKAENQTRFYLPGNGIELDFGENASAPVVYFRGQPTKVMKVEAER